MSTITVAQAYGYASAAGFTGNALNIVVAIAQAESGLVTDARNTAGNTPPSTDRGILQINSYWHPEYTDACCDDPACAFKAGYTISKEGTDFSPWSTYTSGAYLKYMTTALPAGIPRNPTPLSQLHEPTKDGLPDENANDNCGETAAAWVVRDIGNEPDCDGDEIHDEVIGQGVIGGSDLLSALQVNPKYASAMQKRAVTLSVYFGTQAELVAKCHEVMNQPAGDVLANFGGGSNYLNQFSDPAHYGGFGHICVIAHSISGGLELMDPWIGGYRNYTDAQLEQMIVWGYIVIATPSAGGATQGVPTVLPISAAAGYFTQNADGSWQSSNGHKVEGSILAFYRSLPFPNAGLFSPGLPITDMIHPSSSVWIQVFERGAIVCDPSYTYDRPPGVTGDCYFAHIDSGLVAKMLNEGIDPTLQSQLDAANASVSDLTSKLATANSSLSASQAQVAQLQQQLTAAGANGTIVQNLKTLLDDLGITHN